MPQMPAPADETPDDIAVQPDAAPDVAATDTEIAAPEPDDAPAALADAPEPDVQDSIEGTAEVEESTAAIAPEAGDQPAVQQTPASPDAVMADDLPEQPEAPANAPVEVAEEPAVVEAPSVEAQEPALPATDAAVPEAVADADLPAPQDAPDAPVVETEPPAAAPAEPDVVEQQPEEPSTDIALIAPTDPSAPMIGKPAGSLLERDDTARSTRLPSVGAEPADEAAEPAPSLPVDLYAADVEIDETLPRMAVLLIDDGQGPLGPDALDSFPFPVTFAIDPSAPDAQSRMAAYRAKGFEVMSLVKVPEGAAPQDVEIALQANLVTLPEVVGVVEAPEGGLQGSRAVSDQVANYLLASGHGLVLQPNGLNTAQALAERLGVPSNSVFRDFDGDGQDPRVQRRFLDQAAFKARQEGGVIMMGRLQADTISALLLWGLQDRAGQVALVPVTKVLSQRGL